MCDCNETPLCVRDLDPPTRLALAVAKKSQVRMGVGGC